MIDHSEIIKALEKYHGFFSIQPKFPVKTQEILSLAYSPGVGGCCQKIKESNIEIDNLTNKRNSVLLIGLGDPSTQTTNLSILPKLESLAIFYKYFFDIDAYPMVINPELGNKIDEFVELLSNLNTAYAGFELFGFEGEKFSKMMDLCQREYIDAIIAEPQVRDILEEDLDKSLSERIMKKSILVGALLKASLELKVIQGVPTETLRFFVDELKKDRRIFETDDLFAVARIGAFLASKSLISTGLVKQKINNPENIAKKLLTHHFGLLKCCTDKKEIESFKLEKDVFSKSIKLHACFNGVIETACKVPIKDTAIFKELFSKEIIDPLSEKIKQNPIYAADCSSKKRLIAVITNGTAVLGYGNLGPEAALPVMEGKCLLFKALGDVDAYPICIKELTSEKVVRVISNLALGLAGINLEDIRAPDCFDIERELAKKLDIPVFHDDQHGTAIIVAAGLINSLKICKKNIEDVKVVINGAGAAGISIANLLLYMGCNRIIVCDTKGIIYSDRTENMNKYKKELAERTNPDKISGHLKDALKEADIFIGVSAANCLQQEWISDMNPNPIIFALANPIPEIWPDKAKEAGAKLVATGRSDLPNQLNNYLAFPGVFRGLIDSHSKTVTIEMKLAAARAIASLVRDEDLTPDFIIPTNFNPDLVPTVANAVMKSAVEEGTTYKKVDLKLASL